MTAQLKFWVKESFWPLFLVLMAIIGLALVIDARAEQMAATYKVVRVDGGEERWNGLELGEDEMNAGEAGVLYELDSALPVLEEARKFTARGQFESAARILIESLEKNSNNAVVLNEIAVVMLQKGNAKKAAEYLDAAIAANPQYFRAYYNRAVLRTKNNELKEAANDYETAVSLKPNHFESLYNLGLLRMKQGRHSDAVEILKRSVQKSSGDKKAAALFSMARAQAEIGQTNIAVKTYNRAIEYRPNYILPRYNLALLHLKSKDPQGLSLAANRLNEIIALKPDFAPAYFVKGRIATTTQKVDEALAQYRTAIRYDPMFYKARYNLGLLYLELQRFADAGNIFSEMAIDFPDEPEIQFNLGRVAYAENRFDDANTYYKAAIAKRNGDYDEAQLNLGIILSAQKKYTDALEIFDQLALRKPSYSPTYLNRGLVLYRLKKYDEAREAYLRALSYGASAVKVYYNIARLETKRHQLKAAKDAYEQALYADAGHFKSLMNLGVVCAKLGQLKEAESAYKKAIQISPNDAAAYNNLAMILRKLNRWKEAAHVYEEVVRLDSENLKALNNLGVSYAKSGNTEKAALIFERLLEMAPGSVKARYNLALQLKKTKSYERAKAELRSVLKLDPRHLQSHISMASILLIQNQPTQALPFLQRAQTLSPENPDVKKLFALLESTKNRGVL